MRERLQRKLLLAGSVGVVIVSLLSLWAHWVQVTRIVPTIMSAIPIFLIKGVVVFCWVLVVLVAAVAFVSRVWRLGWALLTFALVMAVAGIATPSLAHRLFLHRNRDFIVWAREALPAGQPVLVRPGEQGLDFHYWWTEDLFAMRLADGRPVLGSPIFDGAFVVVLDWDRSLSRPAGALQWEWDWKAILYATVFRTIADHYEDAARTLLEGERETRKVLPWPAVREREAHGLRAVLAVRYGSSVFFLAPVNENLCLVAILGAARAEPWAETYWIAKGWRGGAVDLSHVVVELGLDGAQEVLEKTGMIFSATGNGVPPVE